MRCLSLACELKNQGAAVSFICADLPGSLSKLVTAKHIDVLTISLTQEYKTANNIQLQIYDSIQTSLLLEDLQPDLVIVDHYSLNEVWENKINRFGLKIMVIDDLADRNHHCDILLDQNDLNKHSSRYNALVSESCELLLGPKYVMLRDEFKPSLAASYQPPESIKRLLLFFSLGDDKGETLKAMAGVEGSRGEFEVDIVVGKSNPNLDEIKKKCAENSWEFHCQVDYMSELMMKADLIIGGGGSTSWEKCFLGIPSLSVILAENQVEITESLENHGAIINLGSYGNVLPSSYSSVLDKLNTQTLKEMSSQASLLVDGKGIYRVAKSIFSILAVIN